MMSTYNMDVEPGSRWLHVTPGASTGQPYYCTEVGSLAARAQFEAIRCAKDGYLLIRTRQGAGFVEQNEFQVLLEPGMALLLDCGLPQVFRAADGRTPWHFDFAHIEGPGVDTLDAVIRPNRRPGAQALPGAEYDELFEELLACAQQESAESAVRTGLAIHSLLAAMARQQLSLEADKPTRRLIERSAAYLREHCCEALNLDDILAGMGEGTAQILVEPDRRRAIRLALEQGKTGDVILLAGKGHETYQEIGEYQYHFDEREEVAAYFQR